METSKDTGPVHCVSVGRDLEDLDCDAQLREIKVNSCGDAMGLLTAKNAAVASGGPREIMQRLVSGVPTRHDPTDRCPFSGWVNCGERSIT